MTEQEHAHDDYMIYWKAWFVLLVITLAMVFIGNKTVLIAGMTLKATIISLWFMHLKYERAELMWSVIIGIFFFGLFLFLLMVPDGMAM